MCSFKSPGTTKIKNQIAKEFRTLYLCHEHYNILAEDNMVHGFDAVVCILYFWGTVWQCLDSNVAIFHDSSEDIVRLPRDSHLPKNNISKMGVMQGLSQTVHQR